MFTSLNYFRSADTKSKPKTSDELDMDLDTYRVGKDAAIAAKLDADLDSYRSAKSAEASSAPES